MPRHDSRPPRSRLFCHGSLGLGLAALALLAAPGPAFAQQQGGDTLTSDQLDEAPAPLVWNKRGIIIKAGATYAHMRGELDFGEIGRHGFKGGFGFAAGVSLEIPLSAALSVQPEMLIVRKFTKIDLGDTGGELTTKLGVNYLEFPLLLKWYPGGRRGVHTNLVVGPTPAFKLAATREIRSGGEVVDVPASDLIEAFGWGLTAGVSFEFHELFSALTLDLRYNHGLTDVGRGDDPGRPRWSVVYMLVGVKF